MGAWDQIVYAIRAFDRRGGFTAKRGEAVYAVAAPRFAGPLHARILADVTDHLNLAAAPTIVDLGAGPGTLTIAIGSRLPRAEVIGVEPNPRMLELAWKVARPANVRFVVGSAERLPLETSSVDLVISSLSAHHWDDLATAIAELRRVLRPGGQAWIYDIRFATYTDAEIRSVRQRLGLSSESLSRWIPGSQGRVALFAVIGVAR
jgi:ubiquinone/menaquinone biosynthesis C-methylase UbiE